MVLTAGYDIETFGTSDRLVCGSIVYEIKGQEIIETFNTKEALKNRIIELGINESKKGSRLQLYAHNSLFEFSRIFGFNKDDQWIENKREGINVICIGKAFLADYRLINGERIINFLDSYSLINRPLDECGKIVGLEKISLLEELRDKLYNEKGEMKDFSFEEMQKIREYNIRDSKISLKIHDYVKGMLELEGYRPRMIITAGQISMALFNNYCRRNRLQKAFMVYQENPQDIAKNGYQYVETKWPEEIHSAYRGGRLEAIQLEEHEDTYGLDVNSFYAKCMTEIDFPIVKTQRMIENPLVAMDINSIINEYGITNCIIECPKQNLGYLAVRLKYGKDIDENVYPKHKCVLEGTWTNLELKRAIELGYKIKEIKYTINYQTSEINPLKEFVKEIYKKRLKSDFGKGFYKLILNNLHGKFAQQIDLREYRTDDIGNTPKLEEEGWKVYADVDDFNCLFYKDIGKQYGKNHLPIISAYTTAKARDIIYNEASKLPKGDLLYLSVDGITFKNKENLKLFNIGTGLGEMKVVKLGVKTTIFGKNNWITGNDIKISGIRKEFLEEYKGEMQIQHKRFRNITNAKSLKESFEMESLTKDLSQILEKTKEFNKHVKAKDRFVDKLTKIEIDTK